MKPDCPADEELLPIATSGDSPADVRDHVQHCSDCQNRVRQLADEVAELRKFSNPAGTILVRTTIDNEAAQSLSPGTVIGRYCIVGCLGAGGQAEVYRVVDSELERFLVLKLARRAAESRPGRRDAMLAEGRLLAELDHPGLVRIFDVGLFDGRPYLVLEHVPGRNLEQAFSEKLPSATEAARLIASIAQVVAYAHHHGVIHGDITPRNILIDRSGRPRLIDFGLSKIEDARREDSSPNGGTPEFLPPETFSSADRLGRLGPASDVFGLGATLYWLLTGQRPFVAPTVAEALQRSRTYDLDLDALRRAGVPWNIAKTCRRALAKEPAHRPSADVLARSLEQASRRWFTPKSVGTAIALLLAAAGTKLIVDRLQQTGPPVLRSPIQSTPVVTVFRNEGIRTLSNEIPLHTGDRIAVTCNLSPGLNAVMYWLNAAGELKKLTPERDVADKIDRLVYPAPRRSLALEAPEGTELIFCCQGELRQDDVTDCFPVGNPLPAIPSHNWLLLQRSEVRFEGALRSGVTDELLKMEQIMKEIDRKLRLRYEGVTAIAFSHHPAIQPDH